jgi:hypothetical protein
MAMFRLIVAATIVFFLAVRSSCLTAGLATSSALRQRHPSVLGGQTLRGQWKPRKWLGRIRSYELAKSSHAYSKHAVKPSPVGHS